jgi:circadian clock protein KaiC
MRKPSSRLTLLKKVPTGINGFDEITGGGLPAGRPTLVCGSAGCGKSLFGLEFLIRGATEYGDPGVLMTFEESADDIRKNVASLVQIHKMIAQFQPAVVIVDPVSNLQTAGTIEESSALFIRLIDFLRKNGILGFLVSLTNGANALEATDEGISSMVDTWLLLRDLESNGERNKVLHVLKSRGMNHSNQVPEFHITSKGVKLVDAYLGSAGVLTGSARLAQEAHEVADAERLKQEMERREMALSHRRKAIEAQIKALQAAFDAEAEEFRRTADYERIRLGQIEVDREAMARSRRVTERSRKNNHK